MPIVPVLQQAASPAPPIPLLPPQPGAATIVGPGTRIIVGGPGMTPEQAAQAAQDAAQGARDAAQAQRDAAQAIRDAAQAARDAAGQSTTGDPGFIYDPNNVIPPEVVPLTAMSLAMLAVIFIGWPLSRAFARRLDRKAEIGTVRAGDLQPQIRQLQESLDAMAVELERISEAQRFQAKLMAERAPALPAESRKG